MTHPTPTTGTNPVRAVPLMTLHDCPKGHLWQVDHRYGSELVMVCRGGKLDLQAATYVETRDEDDQWVEVFTWPCLDHTVTWERVTLKPDDGVPCSVCGGTGTVAQEDARSLTWDRPCWCCEGGEAGVARGRHRTVNTHAVCRRA